MARKCTEYHYFQHTYWDVMARLFWPWRAFEAATGHPAHDHEFRREALMVRGVTTARGWQARPTCLR